MKSASPKLVFLFLAALAYTLGTAAHLRAVNRAEAGEADGGAVKKLLGDGRRLFSGQFVEMADVYFHSGMYPSIFDRAGTKAPNAVTAAVESPSGAAHDDHAHDEHGNCQTGPAPEKHAHEGEGACPHCDHDEEHVKAMTPGGPRNWLEAFIRRFRITQHTHLAEGNEREILPWLKLAIELDPQAVETYTTAAFWLREMDQTGQAEEVLREGIRNNPTNHELLFEMGRLYHEDRQEVERARNIWHYALKCWQNQSEAERENRKTAFAKIAVYLAELELEAGQTNRAGDYFQLAKPHAARPDAIQARIDELQRPLAVSGTQP
jgi:tetratricopeptide (TPR) repeat protein